MPVISSGQLTIVDVTDGVNARLTNETHVVPEPATGAALDLTGANTTMSVFFGANDDSNNWQFAVTQTVGLTGQLTGRTYQVNTLPGDSGYVDITASRIGFSSVTSRFTVARAKRGAAGPAIALVASSPGFFYEDGQPNPLSQTIAFTLVRNEATDQAIFFASDNLPLQSDNGRLSMSGYLFGTPGVSNGDTVYLDISAFGNRQKATVNVICGGLSATANITRLERSTAEAGATVGGTIGVNIDGQITAGNVSTFIANAAIQEAQIGDAQITNAKIGNVIQSTNYVAGSAGWKIDKTGNMELNAATFRGTIDVKNAATGARLEIKNNVIKVFDANNVLRVRIGDLTA